MVGGQKKKKKKKQFKGYFHREFLLYHAKLKNNLHNKYLCKSHRFRKSVNAIIITCSSCDIQKR